MGKISGWCEFIGYIGSISLKFRNLRRIGEDEASLTASIEIAVARGIGCGEEEEKLRKLGEKKTMKRLSTVQDLADGLMALADIRDGKGRPKPQTMKRRLLIEAHCCFFKNKIILIIREGP
ncbi:unnamed protein product [Ilex paraguariensis]|uniref:Uncharacterized protein n=1 Tax=Ilex paraguariensis TaxID=185542 RepID=A0ABC8T437_9AQUA